MAKPKHSPLPWRRRMNERALLVAVKALREVEKRQVEAIRGWMAGKLAAAKVDESDGKGRSDPPESNLP